MIDTDYLITLADMDEDSLYILYKEAIEKLRNKNTSTKERKVFTLRVMMIRSLISDKYSLRAYRSNRSGIDFDNPMNNESVARFYH